MTIEEIICKIAGVIEGITGLPASDTHADSALMDDLELSSLEIMTIFADLGKVFHIRLNVNDLLNVITVADIAQCIQNKLN